MNSDLYITDRLISLLETSFPDRLPDRPLSDFEQGKIIGQREVIQKLKALAKNPSKHV